MSGFVIHASELASFAGAVYVGRRNNRFHLEASPFANPYPVVTGRDGRHVADILERYRLHLLSQPALVGSLPALRNRPLACWCRRADEPEVPTNRCHADILLEELERRTDAELSDWALHLRDTTGRTLTARIGDVLNRAIANVDNGEYLP